MHWVEELNQFGKKRMPCAFFIDFEGNHGEVYALEELINHNIQLNFPNFSTEIDSAEKHEINIDFNPLEKKLYEEKFDKVLYHLQRGDTYLLNLTFSTPVAVSADLNAIYEQAKAKYRIKFKDEWVCFSPETFIQIQDNLIATFPMKGTIRAEIPDAENKLRNNLKEKAEHHTIVDLLRNDLSMNAKKVTVEKLMYTEKIRTPKYELYQMSSKITGEMPDNWHENVGTILRKMLPAGSVSGAPKAKTIEIIKTVENHQRGYYCGIAGIFDGENLDTCVLIRFIEKTANGFVYKSGGGITAMSNMDEEYEELMHKIYVPVY